ncbi:MAG: FAD-dependent oxidoreductase [Pelovirga sp.]
MRDPLFEPVNIGTLTLHNRILMPAMHLNMCADFRVTDQLLAFYAERAQGGAGLICVGYATVDELAGQPGNIGAHDDRFIPGLSRLAATIKDHGAAACVQLNHAGRYNHSLFLGGKKPVAPSPLPSRLTNEMPRQLEAAEIARLIADFAAAARRVQQSGFDAVEVLAGTGYLISEFLSPLTNQRQDDYGGSLEKRMRFGLEVITAIKQVTGPEFPLLVRINGNEFMPGGSSRDALRVFAEHLVAAGADALCVNVGWHEARVPQIVTKVPRGIFAYLARSIRQHVTVPVIASHRINDPGTARQLLAAGACDLVAMGRALIADPHLPRKARSGREPEIIHCVACAQGCFDNLFRMKAVECLCNPRAGHEAQKPVSAATRPQQVLVAGGGAAGMSAALAAAELGHRVTLCETGSRLGGQLTLAGAPPGRAEFAVLADDLGRQLSRRQIRIRLNVTVDQNLLQLSRPDHLILATGGRPVIPPLPGVDLPHVIQAWDLLAGRVAAGQKVVIIGGGAVGVEAALFLAEQGTLSGDELKFLLIHQAEQPEELYRLATCGSRQITLIEMIDKLGTNFGRSTRWGMLQDLQRYAVKTLTGAQVRAITPAGVSIAQDGKTLDISADTVVLAVGTRACNPLQSVAEQLQIPFQVVGDARTPALVFDAIHQGYAAGRGLGDATTPLPARSGP